MNGDTAVKADYLTETSTSDQEENVKENILTSVSLEPVKNKQENGYDNVDPENTKSDEKLSSDDVTKNPDETEPVDSAEMSTKNASDESIKNPDKVGSDKIEAISCILEEKVAESNTDPLAPPNSDSASILCEKILTDKHKNGHDFVDSETSKSDDNSLPDDVPNNPIESALVDKADKREEIEEQKKSSEDILEHLDKGASDENEAITCNLNCEEKVAESDTDPLAPHSSDSERTDKLTRSSSPLNNDEAVSVNSESDEDELLCLGEATPNSDIILIDGDQQNGNSEVHEILSDDDNDDCIVTSEKMDVSEEINLARRRTGRVGKRRNYCSSEDEEGSDLEVIPIDDPLNSKTKIKITPKRLLTSAKKKAKKTPDILVVDAMDIVNKRDKSGLPKKKQGVDSKTLQENIAACGTTITPISTKDSAPVTIAKQPIPEPEPEPVPEPEPILPSLTDDMFVVEAPSFIVPYVYEKPADVHFRKFVDQLAIELEEQKAKEEELKLQIEKEEREKREKEIQERKERGEDYSDLLDDNKTKEEEKQRKKQLKEERRRKRKAGEEDDPAWEADNSESSSSEDLSDDDLKARDEELAMLPTATPAPKTDSYFTTTLGKFFTDIGMNLVQEHVQCDLLKQENRKLNREKRGGYNIKATQSSIAALTNNIEKSKEKNASFTFAFQKCKLCSFKTESSIIMANHMEVPHMKNNMFVCNFCLREIKGCHDILVHMLLEHQVKGRLERSQVAQQCSTCPYEDNNKTRMARHVITCMKKYKPETNLTILDWEPPAKIPKLVKPPLMHPSNAFLNSRGMQGGMHMNRSAQASGTNPFQGKQAPLRSVPRPNILSKSRDTSKQIIPPPKGLIPPNTIQKNRPGMEGVKASATLAINPLPGGRGEKTDNSFVMCEICDGYIKDLDQLRNHMLWIHKIKIHPKMIHNRPPLNCQKCQFRFFTDQGLERHLLGAHGLVTNSMQEAANSRKDCGRCPICGRVYQYKLLGHVARDHNMALKPAHLSYKCTVCTATFDTYKEFESHVYSAHRVVTRRLAEKAKVSETTK